MIKIPPDQLPKDTLYAIAESFVLREGTDYGFNEHSLDSKVKSLIKQIERGDIVVSYDESTESCNLLTKVEAIANGIV